MSADTIAELIKLCLTEGLMVAVPIMAVALIVGITVSILQTITSVQEQTLAFVPKLIAAVAVLWVLSPWFLQRIGGLATQLILRASEVVR
jgi:flagellar biosynthetic protein FliQ